MSFVESFADPGLILFFSLPGFMLLKGWGYKADNGYEHLMMSLFWGTAFFLGLLLANYMAFKLFGYDAFAKGGSSSLYMSAFGFAVIAWPIGYIAQKPYEHGGRGDKKPNT